MNYKKFAKPVVKPGFTIVKHDGCLWHLISIDEDKKFHWIEVVQNNDGTFCCTRPNRAIISDSPLKDED